MEIDNLAGFRTSASSKGGARNEAEMTNQSTDHEIRKCLLCLTGGRFHDRRMRLVGLIVDNGKVKASGIWQEYVLAVFLKKKGAYYEKVLQASQVHGRVH